jgi:hypothetical protein
MFYDEEEIRADEEYRRSYLESYAKLEAGEKDTYNEEDFTEDYEKDTVVEEGMILVSDDEDSVPCYYCGVVIPWETPIVVVHLAGGSGPDGQQVAACVECGAKFPRV